MNHIRNFSIIAHIDHGKSTLADRIIQRCGGLTDREMEAQVLDSMDIERERGITIKAQTAALQYTARDGAGLQPQPDRHAGPRRLLYEVSRSLSACEGALLVVDASQGVEAQTVANCYTALELGVEVVPVLNKMDLPQADPENAQGRDRGRDRHRRRPRHPVLRQDRQGIDDILEAVIAAHAAAARQARRPAAGDDHRLLVRQLRRRRDAGARGRRRAAQGRAHPHDGDRRRLRLEQMGVFTPKSVPRDELERGRGGLRHRRHQGTAGGQGRRHASRWRRSCPTTPARPASRCPASRRSSRRSSPACTRPRRASTTSCATRSRSSSSTTARCATSPRSARRWASASAAASSACCTWRSCRSGWSASSTRT